MPSTSNIDSNDENNNRTPSRSRQMSPLPTAVNNNNSSRSPPTSRIRRRAYSWRGESPPYESPDKNPSSTNSKNNNADGALFQQAVSEKWFPLILREARCVATLVAGAALLQCCIALLLRLASFAYPLATMAATTATTISGVRYYDQCAWGWKCIFTIPSIFAGCLVRVIPPQVISHNCPGFIYASAWLLMAIKGKFGSLPHIPSRICEACLGRLSAMECLVVVLSQLVCTVSTVAILQYSNTTEITVLPHIEYTGIGYGDGNPWIVDYFHELAVNTVFTVALQVVPVLLRLNRVSPWLTLLFVYPLYTYGVDSTGKASTLSPSILFALCSSRRFDNAKLICHLGRCIPQVVSGVLAGKIMKVYFPDDSAKKRT